VLVLVGSGDPGVDSGGDPGGDPGVDSGALGVGSVIPMLVPV